ncbi:hypothetical protein FGIG_05901 [Fasciola gigantica]|uniref:Uncharacterized protein n=1 Tax=Fasciola gigantica TaxID=46835 RepID=A0A504YXC7_FASGI|nr:hypothetical protein FGIG_05901 [Fasciola gigantica]
MTLIYRFPGFFQLHEYRCVTRQECLQMKTSSQNGTELFYSVHNGTCLRNCPARHIRDVTGNCTSCRGSDCIVRDCGHIRVQTVTDLELIRHCVSARSLLISLRQCDNESSIRPLNLTIIAVEQRSVHFTFATLTWDDSREVLPSTLHFRIM